MTHRELKARRAMMASSLLSEACAVIGAERDEVQLRNGCNLLRRHAEKRRAVMVYMRTAPLDDGTHLSYVEIAAIIGARSHGTPRVACLKAGVDDVEIARKVAAESVRRGHILSAEKYAEYLRREGMEGMTKCKKYNYYRDRREIGQPVPPFRARRTSCQQPVHV